MVDSSRDVYILILDRLVLDALISKFSRVKIIRNTKLKFDINKNRKYKK